MPLFCPNTSPHEYLNTNQKHNRSPQRDTKQKTAIDLLLTALACEALRYVDFACDMVQESSHWHAIQIAERCPLFTANDPNVSPRMFASCTLPCSSCVSSGKESFYSDFCQDLGVRDLACCSIFNCSCGFAVFGTHTLRQVD